MPFLGVLIARMPLQRLEYADKAILGSAYAGIIGMIPMAVNAGIICAKQKKQDLINE